MSKLNAAPVSTSITITVSANAVPIVTIERGGPASEAALPFDNAKMLRLVGTAAMSSGATHGFNYLWTRKCVVSGVEYDSCNPYLDLAAAVQPGTTSITTSDIDLKANSLGPNGLIYKFTLRATVKDSNGDDTSVYGEATKVVTTNYHPVCDSTKTAPSCIALTPLTGDASHYILTQTS